MSSITVNGRTYSDDGSSARDMADGGFRQYLLPMLVDAIVDINADVTVVASQVVAATTLAALAATSAASAATAPGTNATSATNATITLGAVSVTLAQVGKLYQVGQTIVIASTASPANWMSGPITAFNAATGVMSINALNIGGAGTFAAWTVSLSGPAGITGVLHELKGAAIASAAVINLDTATGQLVHITGAVPIGTMTLAAGERRILVFDGAIPLTHSATQVLPGEVSFTTAAGDMCTAYGDGGGVTLLLDYRRKDGTANVVSPTPTGDVLITSRALTAPAYLKADGASYLKTSYPALAAALGSLPNGCRNWLQRTVTGAGNSLQSLAYGLGRWIASFGQTVSGSVDLVTWVGAANTGGPVLNVVRFVNNLFLACGASAYYMRSVNGTAWSAAGAVAGQSAALYAIAYGAGKYVMAGASGIIVYSADAINWLVAAVPTGNTIFDMAFGNGIFVGAINLANSNQAITSPDGVNWTLRAIPHPNMTSVAFGNGVFVATTGSPNILVSTDGISWMVYYVGAVNFSQVVFGSGTFFAIAGGAQTCAISIDAASCVQRALPGVAVPQGAAFGNGMFAVLGPSGGTVYASALYTYNAATEFATPEIPARPGTTSYVKA